MRRAIVASILLFSTLASAQLPGPPPDPVLEKRFRAEVAVASAEAAAAYDEGNAARDAGRMDEAVAAYRKAVELAPRVDHPHRRLCWALAFTARFDDAVRACEDALKLAPTSPYDKSALASVLIMRNAANDLGRASDLAREAAEAAPDDIAINQAWCSIALQINNPLALATCSERLLVLDPNSIAANVYGAVVAMGVGDIDEARRLLLRAKEVGLPPEIFEGMSAELDRLAKDSELLPFSSDEALAVGSVTLGVWLLVFMFLMMVGGALSRRTLRTVDDAATEGTGSAREKGLRRRYRIVLALAGVFFYASMPLMAVGIVAFALGVLLVFDEMGGIPIYLLWLLGATVIATLIAIARAMFVRAETESLGTPIDLAAHGKLRTLIEEAAAAVGTRPADRAYFAPGTEICVTERTSLWGALRGKRNERSLVLGVAQFDGMTQLQLRSILAHEHGHFRNEDTAGGGFALAVRRALASLDERLADAGLGGFFNPVWWFVLMFNSMYVGISQGASRLQEVLADRWAVHAYGSAAFIDAYRHVVARTVEADDHFDKTIQEVIENKWPLPNLYDHDPDTKKSDEELAADIENAMNREPTVHDSHPSPRQRIEWAERLAVARTAQPDDDARVWDMFDDPDAIERAMTEIVRGRIQDKTGVLISDAEVDSDDDVSASPA